MTNTSTGRNYFMPYYLMNGGTKNYNQKAEKTWLIKLYYIRFSFFKLLTKDSASLKSK